jgi:hypothetical protein
MLKTLLKAQAARRATRVLPGGWVTMLALSPQGRAVMRSGYKRLRQEYERRK